MEYRQFAPLPELRAFVDCLWTLEGRAAAGAGAEPVLPDGRPELVLHFGDPFHRVDSGRAAERQPRLIYAGQLAGQLLLRPAGHVAVLGVRFHPHGAAAVVPVPQHELAGVPAALDGIAAPLARALRGVQEQATDLTHARSRVEHVLLRYLDAERVDARVAFAVDAIRRARGRVPIDALAKATGLTCRHLERRFLTGVGVTPKRLAGITRFQHALAMLERHQSPRLGTETAAACGYADQSHFIRDFRRLAGCSPREHLLRQAELTRFFLTPGS